MTPEQIKSQIIEQLQGSQAQKAAIVFFIDIWHKGGGIMLSAPEAANYQMMIRSFGVQCQN